MNAIDSLPLTPADWLAAGLAHAAIATALAAAVWLLTRAWRNPHAGRVLWGAVLLKLLCPPLLAFAVWPATVAPRLASPARQERVLPRVEPPTNRARQEAALSAPARPIAPAIEESFSPPSPPVFTAPLVGAAPVDRPPTPRSAPTEPLTDGRGSWGVSPAVLALAVWLAGAVVVWTVAATRGVRFGRALRRLPGGDGRLDELLNRAAANAGIGPPVLKVAETVGPLVWATPVRFGAFHRPVVVVPGELMHELSDDAAGALLAHECAHLARRDECWRWLELAACGLWWWLPTSWLAASAGRRCEELCCDAAALAATGDRPDPAAPYAAALLAAAEFFNKSNVNRVPSPASGVGRPAFLKRRFEMICTDNLPRRPARGVRYTLLAAAACAVAVGVTAAQEEPPPAERPAVQTPPAEPMSLADAVATFNAEHAEAAAELGQPPLAIPEIEEAFRKARWRHDRHQVGVKDIEKFAAIVESGTFPAGSSFRQSAAPRSVYDGRTIVSYQIDLLLSDPDWERPHGFTLRESQSDRPATPEELAGPPELNRVKFSYAPADDAEDEPEPNSADATGTPLAEAVAAFNAAHPDVNPLTAEEVLNACRATLPADSRDMPDLRVSSWNRGATERFVAERRLRAGERFLYDPRGIFDRSPADSVLALQLQFEFPGGATRESYVSIRAADLSENTRKAIAAALAAAADDADLPAATRLKLLRESVAPGQLSAERTAALFGRLAEIEREFVEIASKVVGMGDPTWEQNQKEYQSRFWPLRQERDAIVLTLDELQAVVPDAGSARRVAAYAAEHGDPREIDRRRRGTSLLERTAESAAGLAVLIDAARMPVPDEPVTPGVKPTPDPNGYEAMMRGGMGDLSKARREARERKHWQATAILLDAVREVRPTTDAAAEALLGAASSDDPALRAAAVEALARAGGR